MTMTKTVYVVMRQEIDWGGGPRHAAAVFTDYAEAEAYVEHANQTHQESLGAGPPNFHYWLDPRDDVELDPEPYEGETSWVRAVTTGAIESTSNTGTDT
jgi:hypothetical protein